MATPAYAMVDVAHQSRVATWVLTTADHTGATLELPDAADRTIQFSGTWGTATAKIEGSIETDEVESFDSVVEADLLDLWPGDPMEVLVAKPTSIDQPQPDAGIGGINPLASDPPPANLSSELQRLNALSVAERKRYLEGLGFSESAAQRLAEVQEQARLTSIFRIGHVNLKYSTEDGIEIDADFHNYIYVREDPEAEQKPRQQPATLSGAASAASQVSQ